MKKSLILCVAAVAVVATGCSSGTDAPDSATAISVSIEAGTVTPTNQQIDATVGQPITVTIDSDVADELHVHSTPDQSFDIRPAQGQVFEFTVDMPGRVALELHEADKTIATLDVRP